MLHFLRFITYRTLCKYTLRSGCLIYKKKENNFMFRPLFLFLTCIDLQPVNKLNQVISDSVRSFKKRKYTMSSLLEQANKPIGTIHLLVLNFDMLLTRCIYSLGGAPWPRHCKNLLKHKGQTAPTVEWIWLLRGLG